MEIALRAVHDRQTVQRTPRPQDLRLCLSHCAPYTALHHVNIIGQDMCQDPLDLTSISVTEPSSRLGQALD